MQENHWHNTLEEDFIQIFAPFRTIQKITGSCRVDIRDRMVTAPTFFQKCYTVICFLAATFLGGSSLLTYSKNYSDPRMVHIYIFGLSGLHFTFSLSVIHARFFNKGNVELYNKMQKVDRMMRLNWSDSTKIRIKHYKHNRTSVLWLVATFCLLLISSAYLTSGQFGLHELLGFNWAVTTFVFEMGCCSSHILYFTKRVNLINSIIANHLNKKTRVTEYFGERTSNKYSIDITFKGRNLETSDTDIFLKEIFCAFTCFKNQYTFQVFMFCQFFASWTVVAFGYLIIGLQNSISSNNWILDLMHLTIMGTLSIAMLLLLCIRSETFLREVKETKKLANCILSRYLEGTLRQKAMTMLKLIENQPPRFCVYNMWHMDARLLLTVFNITTSSCVIILQFAFL